MTTPVLCETVTAPSMRELRAARDASRAAMVEVRLDSVADPDVAGAIGGRRVPVIVTCRPTWQGGGFVGPEEVRTRLLSRALELGAEFVDLEWAATWRPEPEGLARVVLSVHDFEGVPADLRGVASAMAAERPAVVKIAATPRSLSDNVALLDACRTVESRVVIGMGPKGVVTRVWPARFGSRWTYAGGAAPGQVAVDDMRGQYRAGAATEAAALFGVAGQPVGHSASPAMHNAAFAAAGIDAIYVPLDTADARDLAAFATAFAVQGLSVTAPLKRAAVGLATTASPNVSRTGAANTLRFRAGAVDAENFDLAGFLAPLTRRALALSGIRAVVLGAGGAASAAATALVAAGARVEICARRAGAAAALARSIGASPGTWPPATGWDLLVNATPVGTYPDVDGAPLEQPLVVGRCVYDMVYNPAETTLIRWARAAGADVIPGLEMLVSQAASQFEWWTGRLAPLEVMNVAADAFLNRQAQGHPHSGMHR